MTRVSGIRATKVPKADSIHAMRKSCAETMADYRIGATREDTVEVGNDNAIRFLESARVLSTPQMILFMERTSRNLILPMLDPGHDTVGTHVNVAHRAAAPMGSKVTFFSELLAVNDRRAEFRVQARMGDKIVGEGTHQRAIIEVARFAEKVKNGG
ncbi:MAG TPA: thioesterase family protein [Bryobacteraceae bacterium]|nr:thioesterase family protein [Bryobacteraceae bacterium]